MLPVVDLWDAKEKECHENVEEVKYCEEDHQVMERLLGALSREDEDAEKVAKQTHRTYRDHEDPLNEELEHVERALLLHLLHLTLLSACPALTGSGDSAMSVCTEGKLAGHCESAKKSQHQLKVRLWTQLLCLFSKLNYPSFPKKISLLSEIICAELSKYDFPLPFGCSN